MLNFHTWFPGCNSHKSALLDFFLSSNLSICSVFVVFPPLGYSDVVVSASIDFSSKSKEDAPFHYTAYGYSSAD